MISIIIPVYNQTKQLAQCLESISNQTYENYEIIVINDRSTQRLNSTVRRFKEKFGYKFELFNNQTNHGAPYSRNKGFKLSKGEFVIFCDADVIMKPMMLEIMLETLRLNPGASYAYSSHRFGFKTFRLWPFNADRLKRMPCIHTTSLIRRKHFPASGWDEDLHRFQDWDLFLTMLEEGHTGIWIKKVLFKVRSGGTMSRWLPSFAYRYLSFLPDIRKYETAADIVKRKHGLV